MPSTPKAEPKSEEVTLPEQQKETTNELAKTQPLLQIMNLLSRPTLLFIMQSHNLDKLRLALKRSVRVATCRIYALQALNWFMHSVTQITCLHDLMWWFISSLNPASLDDMNKLEIGEQALEHPLSSVRWCGKISLLLTQSFHAYLQSVADLTLLLPPGSALQQLAIQCFGIKFRQNDHHFLHQSHVFGNISKILSRSDEMREQNDEMPSMIGIQQELNLNMYSFTKSTALVDLAGMFEV